MLRAPPPAPTPRPPPRLPDDRTLTWRTDLAPLRADRDEVLLRDRVSLDRPAVQVDGHDRAHVLVYPQRNTRDVMRYLRDEGDLWWASAAPQTVFEVVGGEVRFVRYARRDEAAVYTPEGFAPAPDAREPSVRPFAGFISSERTAWRNGDAVWTLADDRLQHPDARDLTWADRVHFGGLDGRGAPWIVTDAEGRAWLHTLRDDHWTRAALCPDRSDDPALAEARACRQRTCEVSFRVCEVLAVAAAPDGSFALVRRVGTRRTRVGEEPVAAQPMPCPPGHHGGPCGTGPSWRAISEDLATTARTELVTVRDDEAAVRATIPDYAQASLSVDGRAAVHLVGLTAHPSGRFDLRYQHLASGVRALLPVRAVRARVFDGDLDAPFTRWNLVSRGWFSDGPFGDTALSTGYGAANLYRDDDGASLTVRGSFRIAEPCVPRGLSVEFTHADPTLRSTFDLALLGDRMVARLRVTRPEGMPVDTLRGPTRTDLSQWTDLALTVREGVIAVSLGDRERFNLALPAPITASALRVYDAPHDLDDTLWHLGPPSLACRESGRAAGFVEWRRLAAGF